MTQRPQGRRAAGWRVVTVFKGARARSGAEIARASARAEPQFRASTPSDWIRSSTSGARGRQHAWPPHAVLDAEPDETLVAVRGSGPTFILAGRRRPVGTHSRDRQAMCPANEHPAAVHLLPASLLTLSVYVLVQPLAHAAPVIVWPENGDTVSHEFTVKISFPEVEFCDVGGCDHYAADLVRLYEASSGVYKKLAQCGSCTECTPCTGDTEAELEAELPPGNYTLQVRTDSYVVEEFSEPIIITVRDDGCECGVNGSSGFNLLWCFGALYLLGRRRR